jgi:hypothetical protein
VVIGEDSWTKCNGCYLGERRSITFMGSITSQQQNARRFDRWKKQSPPSETSPDYRFAGGTSGSRLAGLTGRRTEPAQDLLPGSLGCRNLGLFIWLVIMEKSQSQAGLCKSSLAEMQSMQSQRRANNPIQIGGTDHGLG